MKNNIFELGEEFKKEIEACKQEEASVRKIEGKYKLALEELHANNKDRLTKINEIRLAKIQEIKDELDEAKKRIKELITEKNETIYAYCEKNGHKDIQIGSEYLGETGTHSFKHGFETIRRNTYKCVICGRERSYTSKTFSRGWMPKGYSREIPQDLYDDTTLREDGKSLNMLMREYEELEEYIEYLESLLEYLCAIFGHDAIMTDAFNEKFKCNCCGKSMGYQQYINNHHQAIYRGVVPFHYITLPEGDYVIPSRTKLTLSLPTYAKYQKGKNKKTN